MGHSGFENRRGVVVGPPASAAEAGGQSEVCRFSKCVSFSGGLTCGNARCLASCPIRLLSQFVSFLRCRIWGKLGSVLLLGVRAFPQGWL